MSYLKDREIWLSNVPTGNPPAGYFWKFIQNGKVVVRDSSGNNQIMVATSGSQAITGSLTVTGGITGTVSSASYVEYSNVANKPALVSGSAQITYSGLTGIPSGIVSGSSQIADFGIFATTGSNGFNGNQSITGSLTVTGQVVAQTLNVQQVTSSIVYSSGSNVFGNSLSNTQQFTGSLQVTGSTHYLMGGNVGLNTTNPLAGLQIEKYGSKFDSDVQYNQPSGNVFLSVTGTIADQVNWFGIRGNYNSSSGSSNLLLQANYRDIGSQAGHYISSKATALGVADFIIGKLVTSTSTSTPPTLVPQLTITSTGNVGIGTPTPSANLHVVRANDGGSGTPGVILSTGNGANDIVRFQDGTTTVAVVKNDGSIGAGTASPGAKLHVTGTVEANGSLYRAVFGSTVQDADMTGLTGGNGSEVQIQAPSISRGAYLTLGGGMNFGENLGGVAFYNSNNVDGKRLRAFMTSAQEGATAGEQGAYLSFGTVANAGSVPSERVRINSDGTFLVGATNADVGGSVKGAIIRQDGGIVSARNISSPLHYQSPIVADRMNTMGDGVMYGMWREGIFQAGIGATNASVMTFFTGNNDSMTERMRISAGNVEVRAAGELRVYRSDNARYGTFYNDNSNVHIAASTDPIRISSIERTEFYVTGVERMRITSTGRTLLLGSSSSGWSDANRALLELNHTGSALLGLRINGDQRAYFYHNNSHLYIENMLAGASIYVISNSGGVYLTSGGTSWTSNSDERLKNINGEIENAVDKLSQLRAVNFSWKNSAIEKQNLGLIAQDVEKVFPELIDKNKLPSKANEAQQDETEYLGVRYQELIPVLVKAIQEQQTLIESLKSRIEILEQ